MADRIETPGGAREVRVTRELGITAADFFRTLPGVLDGERLDVADRTARIEGPAGTVEVVLSNERQRHLGSLSLPTLTVELRFRGYEAAAIDAFLHRFEVHFRRGGG